MHNNKVKLHTLTATQALATFKDGSVTVSQYAQDLLDRIEYRDDVVDAWAYIGQLSISRPSRLRNADRETDIIPDKDYVLKQAAALDQIPRHQRGALHGIGVAIADIMHTEGIMSCSHS